MNGSSMMSMGEFQLPYPKLLVYGRWRRKLVGMSEARVGAVAVS